MKTRISVLALASFLSLPLTLLQGCYTQFGPATRPDEPDEYVTSDSLDYDEYTDARRQFYMDLDYPYSGGYMRSSPWNDGWAMYGPYYNGFYSGYGRSTFASYDPFGSYGYGYGYGYSPWYSSWGFAGWAGYGGYYGSGAGHHSMPVGYGGSGRGTTRTIGSRRTSRGSESFMGGSRGTVSQPSGGATPTPSTMSLPSGMRRASTPSSNSTPPVAPRILPTNTGRRGYDGERTPPAAPAPAPSSGSGGSGGRGGERHAPAPSAPTPAPSAPAPAPAPTGTRGGESRGGDGGSRGGNRR
jgi:hypothetical protein